MHEADMVENILIWYEKLTGLHKSYMCSTIPALMYMSYMIKGLYIDRWYCVWQITYTVWDAGVGCRSEEEGSLGRSDRSSSTSRGMDGGKKGITNGRQRFHFPGREPINVGALLCLERSLTDDL